MTVTLVWQDDELELPDLEPPYSITAGYNASAILVALVASPEFGPFQEKARELEQGGIRAGIQQWVAGALGQRFTRERQAIVTDATTFLKGLRVTQETFTQETIDAVYRKAYLQYLERDPMAQAALMIARVILTDHPLAEWTNVPSPLLDCLPGS